MRPIQLSLNQRLGVVAFVLGAGALFASPRPVGTVTLDTRELALIVEGKLDYVSAEDLADWIIQGRGDYRLIDVREAVDYAEYHIPTAEPVSLATLPDYPLWRTEQIVLYSDGGIHAAQTWFLLRANGYQAVYTVWGGLDAWKDEVLFPSLRETATPEEQTAFERRRVVAEHFGGAPRSGVAADEGLSAVVLPTIDSSQVNVPRVPRKKRKKKGC